MNVPVQKKVLKRKFDKIKKAEKEPEVKKTKEDINDEKKPVSTNAKFESLKGSIDDKLLEAIVSMGFETMTPIQEKCIIPLLQVSFVTNVYIHLLISTFRVMMFAVLLKLEVVKPLPFLSQLFNFF